MPLEELSNNLIIHELKAFLEQEKPEIAIISDYSRIYMRFIARWVKQRGGKTILPAVSWAGDHRRWAIKEWIKGLVIRKIFDAVCASGERAKSYYLGLGFSQNQLWKQFNVVDNKHFSVGAEHARMNAVSFRKSLKLPEYYFLFVGALEPWKNVSQLLNCYAEYRSDGGAWGLVIVGVGSQFEILQEKTKQAQIPDIVFSGMKTYDEIPLYYGLASCLVVPSISEPWGLVVNEAEAAGLPIIASNKCGCVPELVHRGINGYVYEPTDSIELIRLMHLISGGSLDLDSMSQSSRQIIQYYTPECWADALSDCVQYLCGI